MSRANEIRELLVRWKEADSSLMVLEKEGGVPHSMLWCRRRKFDGRPTKRQDPDSIERVLRAMGLPFEAPELAVARAPPDGGGGWLGA
jgi:hypothetical protein